MMSAHPSILVAAADSPVRLTHEKLFESLGAKVVCVEDGRDALREVTSQAFNLVVLSQNLTSQTGLEVLRALRASSSEGRYVPVVLIQEEAHRPIRVEAFTLGADDVWEPPFDWEIYEHKVKRMLSVNAHVEELQRQGAELHRLSVTDGLTLVFNHRYFQSRLQEEFRRAQRYSEPLSLMLIDLDHFKRVNDECGHQIGDEVLKEVAATVKTNVRETDMVARYGGEEFVVLLPKTQLAGAMAVAERVWSGVGNLRAGPKHAVRVTLSAGVATYPADDIFSPSLLLQMADEALYLAKKNGRNRVVAHSPASASLKVGSSSS